MKRRKFITLLGSAVAAWPLAAWAHKPVPVIGFLNSGEPEERAPPVAAFLRGLGEGGYIEGQSVAIEYRWAKGQYQQLPALAAELVRREVAVIAATGGAGPGLAAKAATSRIPIVFSGGGGDPVQLGLVESLSHPGGNATGVTNVGVELTSKRLGLLHELVPATSNIGLLVNTDDPSGHVQLTELQHAALVLGLDLNVQNVRSEHEFETVFATFANQSIGALFIADTPLFLTRREKITALAARHAIPTIYGYREFAVAGGLMSYGADLRDSYRLVGVYVSRLLKGEKPSNLPVMQPTKFEFVINLKTARALGLTIPPIMIARADEVIE
jgi:putative ABC transport system substrate-binding protein